MDFSSAEPGVSGLLREKEHVRPDGVQTGLLVSWMSIYLTFTITQATQLEQSELLGMGLYW